MSLSNSIQCIDLSLGTYLVLRFSLSPIVVIKVRRREEKLLPLPTVSDWQQRTRVLCGHPGWSPCDHAHHLYVTINQWRVSVPPCAVRDTRSLYSGRRLDFTHFIYCTQIWPIYINIHCTFYKVSIVEIKCFSNQFRNQIKLLELKKTVPLHNWKSNCASAAA